ncbi:MAG: primosomal protein N' [Chlamydiota bacterium]|jgi:primosomal protein N' (replication factor Y)
MSKSFRVATVIVERKIASPLDYEIPEKYVSKVQKGSRVSIPLRGEICHGTVIDIKAESTFKTLKPIAELVYEKPLLSENLLKLAYWMQEYYCTTLYHVLRLFIPKAVKEKIMPKASIFLRLAHSKEKTADYISKIRMKSLKQAEVLEKLLKSTQGLYQTQLLENATFSVSSIASLVNKGWIKKEAIFFNEPENFFQSPKKTLSDEQKVCLDAIEKSDGFKVHLIFGVTGSGKTEVYLQAIEKVLKRNKTALVLVPEIALTTQLLERFKARFQEKIAVLHHKKSQGERFDAHDKLLHKKATIAIGARSSVFAPMQDLGIIIVDEEHEGSFKQQEENPFYHARDVAVMRGKIENCPVILGSATPSIESFYNAQVGKYHLSAITKRPSQATMPDIHIVDMKKEYQRLGGFSHFSEILIEKMKERFSKGEQTILFLNKRGYYTSFFCKGCENIITCPHCALSLTYHKKENILSCHLCDYKQPLPRSCPKCQSSLLQYKGFGTEHVEKSLKAFFPEMRTLRMDSDTTKRKKSHETYLKEFRSGKADVLIGTQMIAKGLHFPSVTLVGVLNADSSLFIPDFRAQEKVFQLLTQVSGRAGRAEINGDVVIQTFQPEHPVILKAKNQDYLSFYEEEITSRSAFEYPPFTHLWKITFTGTSEKQAEESAHKFRQTLMKVAPSGYHFHPICPCGYAKIKDKYRFQLLVRGMKVLAFNKAIKKVQQMLPKIKATIDVDPNMIFF